MIKEFRGKNAWASNFAPYGFWYDDIWFPTNEHFYQATKTLNRTHRINISKASRPAIAKWMASPKGYKGFKIELRADWEAIKVEVMLWGLRKKFLNPLLATKLMVTYPKCLIEGNRWHDNYWGDCSCARCKNILGKNVLGHLLEKVRLELINERR